MTRAYFALPASVLMGQWPHLHPGFVYAPIPALRQPGEDGEYAEYLAQQAAAQSLLEHASTTRTPRVVLSLNCGEDWLQHATSLPGTPEVVVEAEFQVRREEIVSAHIDDLEGMTHLPADPEAAKEFLRESALLWYDSAEIPELIEIMHDAFAHQWFEG